MRGALLVGVALASCNFQHGSLSRDDADLASDAPADAMVDASIDAPPDGPNTSSCSSTGFSCAGGQQSLVTCNGGCWVKCTLANPITQVSAKSLCNAWGGKLAPIRSQADNDCVANTLFPLQASWLGLEQDSTATAVGGGWTNNSDGVPLTFTNWGAGQPNDLNASENGQEQCAFMPTTGDWHDEDCFATLYRFSCRK